MRLLLASVVVLAASSCSDPSAPEAHGTVAFSYTGAGGGSFSASGNAPDFDGPQPQRSWAAGFMQQGQTHVIGSRHRSGVLVDLALLRFERTTPGSESIDPSCNIDGDASCTGMEMFLNFNGDGDTGDFFCAMSSGTIILTEVSGSRARGTFSGTGSCVAGTGGSPAAFSVSSGTFDVALVPAPF